MQTEDVRKLIEAEIGSDWARTNAYGIDLRRCLVDPKKQVYDDSFQPGDTLELWLVLEEDPDEHGVTKWFLTKCGRSSVLPFTTRGRLVEYFWVIMGDFLRRFRACKERCGECDRPGT
jgi:hypothetical protein